MARRQEKRWPTVCLLSAHPLVLGELQTTLAKSGIHAQAATVGAERGVGTGVEIPAAEVYVLDGQAGRVTTESLLASTLRAHSQAACLVLADDFAEAAAFPLLRLGARGLIRYRDVPEQLARAIEAVAAGNYWVPRNLLSRFVESLVGRSATYRAGTPPAQLSRREQQVLDALLENLSNKEIGARLNITERTVKFHVSRILAKCHVQRRADLILRFYQQGARGA